MILFVTTGQAGLEAAFQVPMPGDSIKNGKLKQNQEDTTGRCIQTRCFFHRDA